MLEVFDLNLKKQAILENAYNVTEKEEINAVAELSFSLPEGDNKNEFCQPYHYVRYNGRQLYRIITPGGTLSGSGEMTYECEHVIATLIDDVLFGAHVIGNLGTYTVDCINYVLDAQTVKRWKLGTCDFSRQFEYGWENENLLAALFSIPNRFVDAYMWTYDTSVYPWTVNLVKIDTDAKPAYYIRGKKNLISRDFTRASQDICTRLYCLGYGEGVNQLTISDVNSGLPYLQSPPEIIEKYGLISRIWVDRRFEDAESLKAQGEAMLAGLQEPQYSVDVSVADLYPITQADYDKAEIGRITMLVEDNIKTYITGITHQWDAPGSMTVTLSTQPVDVAQTIADLADRQRIEQVYSQGATQLYAQSVQANATPTIGAVLNFWIPEEMRIVNKVLAKITLSPFRSYSRSTSGGGGTSTTSSSGGGTSRSTDSGGGTTTTSQSGGGGSTTSASGGGGSDTSGSSSRSTTNSPSSLSRTTSSVVAEDGVSHRHTISAGEFSHVHGMDHTHRVSFPSHRHSVDLPSHTHSVNIPSHTHDFSVPSHTHEFSLPDHTHGIEQGIFEFGGASSAQILVNNTQHASMGDDYEADITSYLLNDDGKIPRGTWHSVTVVPDDLAYVTIDLYLQGFVQSRGGSTH